MKDKIFNSLIDREKILKENLIKTKDELAHIDKQIRDGLKNKSSIIEVLHIELDKIIRDGNMNLLNKHYNINLNDNNTYIDFVENTLYYEVDIRNGNLITAFESWFSKIKI